MWREVARDVTVVAGMLGLGVGGPTAFRRLVTAVFPRAEAFFADPKDMWAEALREICAENGGRWTSGGVEVQVDGLRVRITPPANASKSSAGAEMRVFGLPEDLRFRPVGLVAFVGRAVGGAVLTGDSGFDQSVSVEGPSWEFVARLDAEARATIQRVVGWGAELRGGRWSLRLTDSGQLMTHARWLVAASRPWMGPGRPLGESLQRLAKDDPDRSVRAWSILRLSRLPNDTSALALSLATRGGKRLTDALSSPLVDEAAGAAVFLGVHGGVDVVPALRAASEVRRASPERTAMEEAIVAIQGRVAPGSAGGLSRAEGEGDLSVAADGGELSLGRPG
jgi:hypothetical protein